MEVSAGHPETRNGEGSRPSAQGAEEHRAVQWPRPGVWAWASPSCLGGGPAFGSRLKRDRGATELVCGAAAASSSQEARVGRSNVSPRRGVTPGKREREWPFVLTVLGAEGPLVRPWGVTQCGASATRR